MQEKDLEKFIVFVESMRNDDNNAEVDVIMEGFFNVYGGKKQFDVSNKETARSIAMNTPQHINKVWPKLYASHPEILIAGLQNSDESKSKYCYNFIRKYMKSNVNNKGKLGELIEKGIQQAMKNSILSDIMEVIYIKDISTKHEADRVRKGNAY